MSRVYFLTLKLYEFHNKLLRKRIKKLKVKSDWCRDRINQNKAWMHEVEEKLKEYYSVKD